MTIKLHLIRHAPVTDHEGMIYGDTASVDLESTKGIIESLSKALPSPNRALWYSSGVERAYRSAEAVLKAMNSSGEPQNINTHKGFREQNFGALIGKSHHDVSDHLQFIDGKIYAPSPPEGESIETLKERMMASIKDLKKTMLLKNKNEAVVFCHGGTIRAAHIAIHGLDEDCFIKLDTPPLSHHQYNIDHM